MVFMAFPWHFDGFHANSHAFQAPSAADMYAGSVANAIRKALGDTKAVDFLLASRSRWEHGPKPVRQAFPASDLRASTWYGTKLM